MEDQKTDKSNWIITPRRYFLDPVKWEVMDIPPVDCEKLVIKDFHNGRKKFSAVKWKSRNKVTKNIPIIETQAMQGSCWIMTRKHWDKVIGKLQTEGYGTHYQDSIEMVFKTWKAGGKLMLNKNTWYAHKHRKFKRTHNFKRALADASFKYAIEVWGDYYKKVIMPQWGLN